MSYKYVHDGRTDWSLAFVGVVGVKEVVNEVYIEAAGRRCTWWRTQTWAAAPFRRRVRRRGCTRLTTSSSRTPCTPRWRRTPSAPTGWWSSLAAPPPLAPSSIAAARAGTAGTPPRLYKHKHTRSTFHRLMSEFNQLRALFTGSINSRCQGGYGHFCMGEFASTSFGTGTQISNKWTLKIDREPQDTCGKSRLGRSGQHFNFTDTSHAHLYVLHVALL